MTKQHFSVPQMLYFILFDSLHMQRCISVFTHNDCKHLFHSSSPWRRSFSKHCTCCSYPSGSWIRIVCRVVQTNFFWLKFRTSSWTQLFFYEPAHSHWWGKMIGYNCTKKLNRIQVIDMSKTKHPNLCLDKVLVTSYTLVPVSTWHRFLNPSIDKPEFNKTLKWHNI